MATVRDIREGIDDRLATISGLRHSAVVPSTLNPPHAFVKRSATTFGVSMDGEDDVTFAITIAVDWTNPRTAQQALDEYLAGTGVKSIKAAIDEDSTLGGVVDYAHVTTAEEDRIFTFGGTEYLAADLVVEVG